VLRRTSSLDVTWPEGQGGPIRVIGRARDFLSRRHDAAGRTVAEEGFEALFGPDWKLRTIVASRPRSELDRLIGQSGGGGFRKALREAIPGDQARAAPLALVLDDVPGAVIVSSVAWSPWDPDWSRRAFGDLPIAELLKMREGVCIGHAPGSSAQDPDHDRSIGDNPQAADLPRADEPDGWHAMLSQAGSPGFRRLRRIDVTCGGEQIVIDGEFQDSATRPEGGRIAVHEYGFAVIAERASHAILSIETDPRVLPYGECPSVSANLPRLHGQRLDDLRRAVPASLPGAAGCTHLNDALRGLADVPALLHHLGTSRAD
jgi:hypothetical protein